MKKLFILFLSLFSVFTGYASGRGGNDRKRPAVASPPCPRPDKAPRTEGQLCATVPLSHSAPSSPRKEKGLPPLFTAIARNDLSVIEGFLSVGFDVNTPLGKPLKTPLELLIYVAMNTPDKNKYDAMFQIFIENKVDVCLGVMNPNFLPIERMIIELPHWADMVMKDRVYGGHASVEEFYSKIKLIPRNPKIQDFLARYGILRSEIVTMKTGRVLGVDTSKETALETPDFYSVLAENDREKIEELDPKKINVNFEFSFPGGVKYSILYQMLYEEKEHAVKWLYANGADINADYTQSNGVKISMLDHALSSQYCASAGWLIDHGAPVTGFATIENDETYISSLYYILSHRKMRESLAYNFYHRYRASHPSILTIFHKGSVYSLLYWAIYQRKTEVAEWLIMNGFSDNVFNDNVEGDIFVVPLLYYALLCGDTIHIADKIVEQDRSLASSKITLGDGSKVPLFYYALLNERLDIARWLLEHGADINDKVVGKDGTEISLEQFSVNSGKIDLIRPLVECGVDPNSTIEEEVIPGCIEQYSLLEKVLHVKLYDDACYLLDHGVDINKEIDYADDCRGPWFYELAALNEEFCEFFVNQAHRLNLDAQVILVRTGESIDLCKYAGGNEADGKEMSTWFDACRDAKAELAAQPEEGAEAVVMDDAEEDKEL